MTSRRPRAMRTSRWDEAARVTLEYGEERKSHSPENQSEVVEKERQERALTELIKRKTRLILQTPYVVRGRPMIAHIEAAGLRLREKGRRYSLEISWAQIHNRAAEIAAERSRREARGERAAGH